MTATALDIRRLGDVCDVRRGTMITEKQTTPGAVPVVAGGIEPTYFHSVSNRGPGAITISASGANAGHIAYWDVPIWASDCTTVAPSDDVVGRFVFHQLKWMERRIQTTLRRGAAQPHVYAKDVAELDVVVPPIEEQRRIAALLDAAHALRMERRQALGELEMLTQAIFIDRFGDPVSSREFPRSPIGSVAEVVTGNTPSRADMGNFGDHIEWLKSDNILESGVITPAAERLSEVGRAVGREASAGASLVVCIAGSPRSIGRVGFLDRRAAFNQQINAVIPGNEITPEFLFHQLKASQRLVQRASTNSMKGLVSKSALSAVEIIVPPISEQEAFVDYVNGVAPLASLSQRSLQKLDTLFASLQQRAFRGEL